MPLTFQVAIFMENHCRIFGSATKEAQRAARSARLPILGNLLQLRNSRLHLTAEAWSRTYGEYFRFRIGPRPFLAVANRRPSPRCCAAPTASSQRTPERDRRRHGLQRRVLRQRRGVAAADRW